MKKTRLVGALLACTLAVTGISAVPELSTPFSAVSEAASKLAAPKGLKASVKKSSVTLTWNAVKGADAYRVYKYNDSKGKYETCKNVSGTSCTVKNLKDGTYKFRVAALVKSGSKYSVQTKSSAVSAKVKAGKTDTSASSSSLPISFPALGSSRANATKAIGLAHETTFNVSADYTLVMGTKTVVKDDCMVIMYFNSNDKLFFEAVIIPEKTITSTKLLETLRAVFGKETVSQKDDNGTVCVWLDSALTKEKGVIIVKTDEGEGSAYYETDLTLTPESMKNPAGQYNINDISNLFRQ